MIDLKLGLTKQQLIERRKGIGGSDAPAIMEGGDAWHALWLVKTGKMDDKDLSNEFPPMLGHVTELLNLSWYEKKTGREVSRLGEAVVCKDHPHLRCTLDGYDAAYRAVINAKHVNPFSEAQQVVAHYYPQVTHEMICCGVERHFLSVIFGTKEPEQFLTEYDPMYGFTYLEKCKEFWGYVMRNEPPPTTKAATASPAIKLDDMRVVDMTGNNQWSIFAGDWLAHRESADKFEAAEKGIKKLVETDVKLATGYGVQVKRDKAARLKISAMEKSA